MERKLDFLFQFAIYWSLTFYCLIEYLNFAMLTFLSVYRLNFNLLHIVCETQIVFIWNVYIFDSEGGCGFNVLK